VFALARKWADRYDTDKALEKYKEVVALDPEGLAGRFTDEEGTKITASYMDFARFEVAIASAVSRGPDPNLAPLKTFIDSYPKNPLVREAYQQLGNHYRGAGTKEEAGEFFAEYAARFPDSPEPYFAWLSRILRDKGPVDKGLEIAPKLQEATRFTPNPSVNLMIARLYDLSGDMSWPTAIYGNAYMESQVRGLARSLISYATYWIEKKENMESAVAMADLALKIGPHDTFFLTDIATAYVKAGEDAKALAAFGPSWLATGGDGLSARDLWVYSGFWARQGKNLESALTAARKTVEMEPKLHFFWRTLSDVWAKLGNKAEAIKALEKAVELAPANQKPALQKQLDGLKAAPEKK